MYNPNSNDYLASHYYDRKKIKSKYWNGEEIETIFNRQILSDEFHSVNYIIQSTCAENVLRQMIKVADHLKGSKSFIAFPVHDSIVIDMALEDIKRVPNLVELFGDTELGKFLVNVSAGKTFGTLQKVEI